ncbi:MAG: TolC family protein [Acidobacteriota bacterium]
MRNLMKGLNHRRAGILLVGICLALAPNLRAQDQTDASQADYFTDSAQLRQYIQEALDQNPQIREALSRYRASLEKVPQVTALPDPVLGYTQFVRSIETRVGPQVNSFMISQKLPWFGKLNLEGQMAIKEAAALYQTYQATERELINQTKQTYYELVYIDRALDITAQEQSLLDHYERLAESHYATGGGLQQGVIKIQAEITKLVDRAKMLGQQRGSLVARLNTLRNEPPESPIAVTTQSAIPKVTLNLQELYALGDEHRQELKASMARVEKSERAIDLARKQYWPDLTLSAGMINVENREDLAGLAAPPPDNGKNAYNFSIGINIPIHRDKYRAGVVEATETLSANKDNYVNVRNNMQFDIRDQVLRLQTLSDQIDLYGGVLIPQAEQALRSTESAYETGEVGALDLLDSERFLLQTRLLRARYHTDYLESLARLERAVGTKFPR